MFQQKNMHNSFPVLTLASYARNKPNAKSQDTVIFLTLKKNQCRYLRILSSSISSVVLFYTR